MLDETSASCDWYERPKRGIRGYRFCRCSLPGAGEGKGDEALVS